LPLCSEPQHPGWNLGFKDDVKDDVGCDCRDKPSNDGCLPGLRLHNLEQEADEEEGIDKEADSFEGERECQYSRHDDDDAPPAEWLVKTCFVVRLFSFDCLEKGDER
jgi:hypothetical protein